MAFGLGGARLTGALDSTARAIAGRLIDKYGKALTFTASSTAYDPTTDTVSGGTATYSWNGVLDKFGSRYPQGDTAKHKRTIVYVPAINSAGTAATFVPLPGWTVTVDSEEFRVVDVEDVKGGELTAMWVLETDK